MSRNPVPEPVRYHARPTRRQALYVLLTGLKITLRPSQVVPLYSYPPSRSSVGSPLSGSPEDMNVCPLHKEGL